MGHATNEVRAWSDENGNYWGEGHLSPEAFRDACLKWDQEYGLSEEDSNEYGAGTIDPGKVRHIWMRLKYPGTDNDEVMVVCESGDTGAQPWTVWRN